MFKWWPWIDLDLFYDKVKFGPLCFYMGKSVQKLFNGRNLQQMTRVTWGICLHKNSDTRGLSTPAPGLYTCIKTWKIMYKIRLRRYFFETNGQSDKAFLVRSGFCPQKVVCPCSRAIYMWKNIKKCVKIRIQGDLFETCNKWSKW